MTNRRSRAEAAATTAEPGLDVHSMREAARRVILMDGPQPQLDELTAEMRGYVERLVPEIRTLITHQPAGDMPAEVAQVGVDEAWRRLHTTAGSGAYAAYRRARKPASSVSSLCDHYENLSAPRKR
ncbi:hypothetical protein DDQ41_07535 [Streptomyces spongiicola]|uniref:Uncharacterized protein n=1 Tax=Streptomyces spongiicola TaxID=1690221 RepID=A0ABM6V4T7_9ACTN|nr:DUF6415 family natural product biosynthesis protein [Streptomyces spongiicola]AWK08797.1 hypothetical protein DDQ41_07535 [Streptomyces spongiicola]